MMRAINRWLTGFYLGFTGLAQDLKEDERGLSGVVVAVLLILVAVLAIALLWGLLKDQIGTWWDNIVNKSGTIK